MAETIESKVADAILQQAKQIRIGAYTYDVTPPTPATLIMTSQYIAELPEMGDGNIVGEVLVKAKNATALGKIVATLILGAKRIKENRKVRVHWWKKISEVDYVANYILDNLTNAEVTQIVSQRLSQMQIGDFFGLTTSLSAANLTKATKEVETASGAQ